MADVKSRPWDRRKNENDEQFALFELYMRERDIQVVYHAAYPDDLTDAGKNYITSLKIRNKWEERIQAYDRWIAQKRDDAIKGMVQHEVKMIARYRMEMIGDLHKKVKRVGRQLDQVFAEERPEDTIIDGRKAKAHQKIHIGLVKGYAELVKITDDLMRKVEESNPAEATLDAPMNEEKLGAASKLQAALARQKETMKQGKQELLQ